jgi:hypothetical protein
MCPVHTSILLAKEAPYLINDAMTFILSVAGAIALQLFLRQQEPDNAPEAPKEESRSSGVAHQMLRQATHGDYNYAHALNRLGCPEVSIV